MGIPTVVDRIIQRAIAQQLTPIFEPLFSDGSYGCRPGRSAQMAIQKVKECAEQGYITAVLIELSKYFDTLKHDLLMNMEKSRVVSVYSKRIFKFLGFTPGKGKDVVFIRTHKKSLKKAKQKLKELTSPSQGRNARVVCIE